MKMKKIPRPKTVSDYIALLFVGSIIYLLLSGLIQNHFASDRCDYSELDISLTTMGHKYGNGDTILFDVAVDCPRGGLIPMQKNRLNNFNIGADSGKYWAYTRIHHIRARKEDSGLTFEKSPAKSRLKAVVVSASERYVLKFVDGGNPVGVIVGKNKIMFTYHPPLGTLRSGDFGDSGEGYPSDTTYVEIKD